MAMMKSNFTINNSGNKNSNIQLEVIDMRQQSTKRVIKAAIIGSCALLSAGVSMASDVTVTNTFVAGQPATADSVNQNFTDVKTAVDDNNARVTTNTTNVATNTTNVAANTTGVAANSSAVSGNTAAIATNTTNISTNTTGVGSNATAITSNTTAIGTNTTGIAGHETRITTLEAGGGGGGGSTIAVPVTVSCPSTGAVQNAIDSALPNGRLVITINGSCSENVVITRDDVTLLGGSSGTINGATTSPTILASGKTGIVLENLTVGGGLVGVFFNEASSSLVTNSTIGDGTTLESGMVVIGSTAIFVGGTTGNTINGGSTFEDSSGLIAAASSMVQFKSGTNTLNSGNASSALECELNSSVIAGDFVSSPNVIVNGPVDLIENCNFGMFNGSINGDIFVEANSTLTLEAETVEGESVNVTGDIFIRMSSAAVIVGNGVNVTGNAQFELSSAGNLAEGANITGIVHLRSNSAMNFGNNNSVGTLECDTFGNAYINAFGIDPATNYVVDGVAPTSGNFACGFTFP